MKHLNLILSIYSIVGFFNPYEANSSKFRTYKFYSPVIITILLSPLVMKLFKLMNEEIKSIDQFIQSTFLLPELVVSSSKGLFMLKRQNDIKIFKKLISQCLVKNEEELSINTKYKKSCR